MKVRIKEWDELAEQHSTDEDGNVKCRYLNEDGDAICYCSFTTEMKKYCGEVIDIDEVTFIKDAFIYDDWTFTNDMYEVIEE